MKLIFLGSGSAFTVGEGNYHSNMILETDSKSRLLIDCGSDIRFSCYEQGLTYENIDAVYISHLHADHMGGLEWLAINTRFSPKHKKPKLFVSQLIVDDLWSKALSGGLSSLPNEQAALSSFFEVHPVKDNLSFEWEKISFQLVPAIHCFNDTHLMPVYGLYFTLNGKKIWITSDTRLTPDLEQDYYENSDLIFHDCETSKTPTGVHAHYNDLVKLPQNIKSKMWLYHYSPGVLPDAIHDGFKGFVKKGQVFDF